VKVARLYGVGDIRVVEEPEPPVEPGHSLVRTTAVGLCGSDLHWFAEGGIGDAVLRRPLVLGHEFAGVVERGPLRGRRVAVDPAIPCGGCARCVEGNPNLCPTIRFAGHGDTDGGLRELVAWPDELLHPLPDEVSDAGGALLEPLGVAIHCFDLAKVRVGASVAVIGCGPIGLMVLALARAAGARPVVAVEPLEHRRTAALAMGATVMLSPAEAGDAQPDADVVVEVAGTDDAVELALLAARPGARVVLAGIPENDRTTFTASVARRKGLTLKLVRRMKHTYPRAVALARDRVVDVESLVTDRYPLTETPAAMASANRRSGLKTVVELS
jgi:L-iditol 2-dehydrogenase